jgi:hypothetical protein
VGTFAEPSELPSPGPQLTPYSDKAVCQGKMENLNLFSMLKLDPRAQPGKGSLGEGTGSEEGASIHFPRAAGAQRWEPGHMHGCISYPHPLPAGPASPPPESVLGWRKKKR